MSSKPTTYSLFVHDDDGSRKIASTFRSLFAELPEPLIETDDGKLVIAIGGDGTFLHAVHKHGFDKNKVFAGVNTGTLGYLLDIKPEDFCSFIKSYNTIKELKTRKVYTPKITVYLDNGNSYSFYAINEVTISRPNYKTISFTEYINGREFQKVYASGLCVACKTGDTGLSLSCGGPIDFTQNLQLNRTFIAPIQNAKYPRILSAAAIAHEFCFKLDPSYNEIDLTIDCIPKPLESAISKVWVSIFYTDYIEKLELTHYSKLQTVRNKIVGLE